MNSIEDYQNLLELVKQALLFYAKKNNYIEDIYRNSNIAVDQGSQARFALEKIKEMEETYDKMHKDIMENNIDFFNNANMFNELFNNSNENKI